MISKQDWDAKGIELFGEDRNKWVFHCPACRNELSIEMVRALYPDELPMLRAGRFSVESECIGRYLRGRDCDWAAYGLIRGPVIVLVDDREVEVFDFAGLPFTGPARRRT